MTPALREKTTKGHGIHLSHSLSSSAVESDTAFCMANSRSIKKKIKEDSITQIPCSVLGFPTTQPNLSNDILNSKYVGSSQSSKHYPSALLMNSNSALNINKNCVQRKSGEHDCSKMKNPLHNSTNTLFSWINSSEPEELAKGEISETMNQNLAEMHRQLDSDVKESSNIEEMHLPNCKWYWKNGLVSKALQVQAKTKRGDLLQQAQHDPLEVLESITLTSKEEELNARLLHCVSKQQVLLSRAKRTRKHLQILLAKHVVQHCDHQMKCFVKHQLQRMKVFHDPARVLDSSSEMKTENCTANLESSSSKDSRNGVCIAPGEIWGFALSAAGLLSHVEEGLDSDATCSMLNYCYSEWTWLVDRAKVGSRWTWLQAQISELEYKIQQLTDLHRQIRATKGMVILEEFPLPKDILKKQTQLTDQEALLNSTGNSQAALERQDALPDNDFEISPSSPTLLLRNIEKQSAQLSEIINNLIAPFNLSPTSSPLSTKSCKHKQRVNGISLRASENREERSSSSSWLVDQQHIKKRRKDRTRMKSPSVTLISTSARTRPLQSFLKRKLYKMRTKYQRSYCWPPPLVVSSKDALFRYHTQMPCMAPVSAWSRYEPSTKSGVQEHMLELDSSFHPVLSFPSDIPLHIHFRTLLKKCEISGDPVETSHNTSLRQWSSGYPSNCTPQTMAEITEQLAEGRKRRHLSETAVGKPKSEVSFYQHAEMESHTNFTAVSNVNVMSQSMHSTSSQHNSRRRLRSESSYDIDNIVIPMSLVAPSKLEKLQYKEILTPSWRVIDLQPLGRPHVDEEKVEDLSDEVFSSRHEKYEEREKARWSLWEHCRWPRRNSRSYSRNAEGQQGQENDGCIYPTLRCAAEMAPAIASEIHSSECLRLPPTSKEDQESVVWERRVFPLKDEEVGALLCQDQVTNTTESSSVAFPSDSFGTVYPPTTFPNNGHPPRKLSAEESEDHKQVYLGLGSTRKHR
uniref:KAT8 regulatory NSL complex subunit 1 like n=1 Tax=Sphenodon punctatus TaxID=8508 RepID=A0A8D0H3T2_SPHPU